MNLVDFINAMPDDPRAFIYPVLQVLRVIFGWRVLYEDGSIIP